MGLYTFDGDYLGLGEYNVCLVLVGGGGGKKLPGVHFLVLNFQMYLICYCSGVTEHMEYKLHYIIQNTFSRYNLSHRAILLVLIDILLFGIIDNFGWFSI